MTLTGKYGFSGLLAALALGGACGGGAADDAVDAASGEEDARVAEITGPCPLNERVGVFEIAHRELFSAVTSDGVADAVIPNTVLEKVHTEGSCTLLQKVNPFCDPPCSVQQTCSNDDVCVPMPQTRSVGAVTVTGLLDQVHMEPNSVNGYQKTDVQHPPFEAGAEIALAAAGGDHEGFTLDGLGVAPIEVPDGNWVIEEGEPLAIAWTSAEGPGAIYVSFNVDQHGNSPVTLFCEYEDTGTATVPAGLIDRLLDYGVSGFATANIYRRTVDSVSTAQGCVELRVFSQLKPKLSVAGHVPE
jgi:hypothetical protein